MRVFIPDAGDPPPSFVRNLIELLWSEIEVDATPPVHRPLRSKLAARSLWPVDRHFASSVEQADLVHFQWPPTMIRYRSMVAAAGKPVVLSLRGRLTNIVPHLPGNEAYRDALLRELPRCTGYHCVSTDVQERAVPLGLRRERSHVIRPAVDTEAFRPTDAASAGHLRVAMVGALMWRKSYEHALTALAEVRDRGVPVSLTIAGDGIDRERVEWTIRDLALDEQVRLLGPVDHGRIGALLRASDVLLHTSVSEGIANAVLEAMSAGLGVIVWDAGGMAEAIDDGVDGRLVPARSVEATRDAIIELAGDRALVERLGTGGRARVERDFDVSTRASAYLDLYDQALHGMRS